MEFFEKLKIKYVLSDSETPIEKVYFSNVEIREGEKGFETNVLLKEDLVQGFFIENNFSLYGQVHGSGSDKSKTLSIVKALSEAIERWAFWSSCHSEKKELLGFDTDNSTTGMAAFIGLSKKIAKKIAFNEAVERWALLEWWCGSLTVDFFSYKNNEAFEIIVPFEGVSVVLLHKEILLSDGRVFHVYGFAGNNNKFKAAEKAEIELMRNVRILKKYYESNKPPIVSNIGEKRLIYFSDKGYTSFADRVKESNAAMGIKKIPKSITDNEIVGVWTKYAIVWRILFEQSSCTQALDRSSLDLFLF